MHLHCVHDDVALVIDGPYWARGAARLVTVLGPALKDSQGRPTWRVYPLVQPPLTYNLARHVRLYCTDDMLLPLRPPQGAEPALRKVLQAIVTETL